MPRTAPPPCLVSPSRSVAGLTGGSRCAQDPVCAVETEHSDPPTIAGDLQHDRRIDARERRADALVEPMGALLHVHRVPAQAGVGSLPEVVLIQPAPQVEI